MHLGEESTILVQQLTILSVHVPRRNSLSVRQYNQISLSEALNKIREENNMMAIKKNRVIMLEEAWNKALANGKELNEGKQTEILSLAQCKSDFEISNED